MRKRILALLLALVMCLSLLPTAAFAEDITDTGDTAIITDSTGDDGDSTAAPTGKGEGDSTAAPTGEGEGDTAAAPTGEDEDEKGGEDADEDGNSTEGAADPAPVVGSAPTPLLAAAAPTPVVLGASSGHGKHCVCGKMATSHGAIGEHKAADIQNRDWKTIDSLSSLPSGKYFYLTDDVTITETWTISNSNDVHLCLNGHTITMNGTGPVIKVTSGASITLTDCTDTGKITHGDSAGCGVYVDGTGTFNMFGGIITGNRDQYDDNEPGGGVYVAPTGKFNMYGGKISDNRGTYSGNYTFGGGVYIGIDVSKNGGKFNMYGGTIGGTGEDDGNSADYGAGVYMASAYYQSPPAIFTMDGGEIVGNHAGRDGGGVVVGGYGEFTMNGGKITGNRATGDRNNSAGGGVIVRTDSITVGGNAMITGNKSEGVTSDGKDDNVYLTGAGINVNVKKNFSGAVGININDSLWGVPPSGTEPVNPDWVAVAGDGGSAAITGGKITYDNGDFEIKSNGKLTCLHTGGVFPKVSGYDHCLICYAEVTAKTEFKNAAGTITTRTQYYENANDAFDKAEDNCVITMLNPSAAGGRTWNLGGKTVTLYADYAVGDLTVNNGTLNLGYTRGFLHDYIHNMVVGSGATVNVDVNKSGFYGNPSGNPSLTVESGGEVVFKSGHACELQVKSGGTAELKGGTFDLIKVIDTDGMTCADLLVDGYAYFDKNDSNAIKNGSVKELTNVTVGEHASCTFDAGNDGVCGCGRECSHSSIDFADGKCNTCQAAMTGILVQKTAGGTTVTGKFTTFNAAMDSIRPGDTNVTIKLMENATFEDEKPQAADLSTKITDPCTLDLNGKTLSVKKGVHQSDLEIDSTAVTIKGTGTLNANSVDVFPGSSLTVEGNVNFQTLKVNSNTTVQLKGGTYDKIKAHSGKCLDLLPDKYAYFNGNDLVNGKVNELTNVTVGEHASCTFNAENNGICGCGRECPHSNFTTAADGKVSCSVCNTQMVAQVTKGAEDSTPLYYTTFNAALEGVKDAKNTDNATLTLLADTTLSANATLPGGVYTIELKGKTLGGGDSSYVLTADGNGAATIQDTTGGGKIDCTLKCTVAGSNSPEIKSGTFAKLELNMTSKTGTGWPHLFGGTFGEIVRTDTDSDTASRTIRVISMLAPGYVLEKNGATSDTSDKYYRADTEITATAIENVTVVECTSCTGDSCDFCGKNLPVELTLYGANDAVISREYYANPGEAVGKIGDTATAVNATKATIRLLRKAVGNLLTYTNSIPLTIDLNGQELNSPITVNTTTGSLIITGDGKVGAVSTDKVTVTQGTLYVNGGKFNGGLEVGEKGNAVLSGGTFVLSPASGGMPASKITVAGGKTVGNLLADGYGYWCVRSEGGDASWATTEQLGYTELSREKGISAVTVTALPDISVTPETTSVAYGTPVTLTAAVSGAADGETITYKWYEVNSTTETAIDGETSAIYKTPTDLAIGMHTFICKATVYGYTLTGKQVTVTVTKATLTEETGTTGGSGSSGSSGGSGGGGSSESGSIPATYTAPKANTLTFATQNTGGSNPTAKAQELVTAPTTLPDGCKVYYRVGDGTFAETIPTATNAGAYTVQWYIDGGDNYDGVGSAESPKSLTVNIAPMKVANPSGDGYSAFSVYYNVNGSYTDAPAYTYNGSAIRPVFRLQDDNGFVIPAGGYIYSITDNVNAGNATITIADNDPNDNFEIKESKITFGIDRKPVTLSPNTYTVYVTTGGSVTVDLDKVAKTLGMPANDGVLTFTKGSSAQNAQYTLSNVTTATTTVFEVCSTNHSSNFTLNVVVSEKIVPTVSVTDFTKTYDGTAVTINDVTAGATTGGVNGAWSWTNGTAPTNVADSGYYSLTFTPTGDDHSPATATVQVTINAKNLADSDITATADGDTYTGSVIKAKNLVVTYAPTGKPELTLTYDTDHNIAPGTGSATNAGTHKLTIIGTGNYTGTRQVDWTIAPKPLGIDGIMGYHPTKTYDGTVTADTSSFSIPGAVEGETLESGTDYQITAAFADADVGTNKAVSVTVKLLNTDKTANYCFNLNGQLVKEMTVGAKGYIAPFPLTTPPTAKESIVRIRQDVSVRSGSYLLPDNVDLTLPEGFSPSRELRFTLGNDLPAKLEAQIDENTGMLTYTISGGRSGEKFAIPVTLTMPNFVKQSGAAAVALFALDEDPVQETDPNNDEPITLTFTVEIELTGGGHEHIRRPPTGTGTTSGGANNGSTGGNGSGVASPATGDVGIALYGVLAVLSMTGGAWIGRRKKS